MRLALCYLAFGHACFIAALVMLAWQPGRWPWAGGSFRCSPALAFGLALHLPVLVSATCVTLIVVVAGNGAHLALMLRRARRAV